MADRDKEIAQGEHASRILQDEVYQEAVASLEEDLFDAWKQTKWNQFLKREFIYRQYRVIGEVNQRLRGIMDKGKVSAHNVAAQNKRQAME